MTNVQALSVKSHLDTAQQNTQSSLATMQADIDTALQAKRQASTDLSNVKSEAIKASELLSDTADIANNQALDAIQLSRVIEMAWEDRTPFAAIEHSYGLTEPNVITLMRQQLKPSSFRLWRKRVTSRATKHQAKRTFMVGRAYCKTQYKPR